MTDTDTRERHWFCGDGGFEFIDATSRARWVPVNAWGHDGWDLGSWPLVVVTIRNTPDGFKVREHVKGDVTEWTFATEAEQLARLDGLAFSYWTQADEVWERGVDPDNMPDRLRGPFDWGRVGR